MEICITGRHLFLAFVCLFLVHGAQCLGTTVLEGDVYIQVIGTVYNTLNRDGSCSGINAQSVQNIEAIRWILEKLNNQTYLPGLIKGIGLRVSETCGSVPKAEALALQLAAELEDGTSRDVIGVIGPGKSLESQAVSRLLSSLPRQHRLLQMEYAASSVSSCSREIYKNLFTTIPSDDVQIKAIHSFLQKLRWTYMALIYEDNDYGRSLKNALLKISGSRDVCFPVDIAVDVTTATVDSLAEILQSKMMNATYPVNGAVVLGSRAFADDIASATDQAMGDFPDTTPPVFLFSERSEYVQGTDKSVLLGGFVMSPPKQEIPEFQAHLLDLLKPGGTGLSQLAEPYKSWLQAVSNSGPSVYNQYAVQAAMIIAKVVRTACPSSGICGQLKTLDKQTFIDKMRGLRIDFDNDFPTRISTFRNPDLVVSFSEDAEIARPSGFPLYEAYNFKLCGTDEICVVKVADLKSDQFVFDGDKIRDYDRNGFEVAWPNVRKAQCPPGHTCHTCLQQQRQAESILFEPGDLYVVGIVPVHNPGQTPLQCGEIKSGGLDIVESIRFAIKDAASSLANSIPKGKIGMVIIDSCNDAHIIQEKVLNLHRYGVLQDDGSYVPISDRIIGYIGGWSSDVSTAVASITSRLGVGQIAYASTAPRLSDLQAFPYFLRTPTPDDAQADTLLRLVKHFKSDLIQILYSETAYGEGGRDAIQDLSGEMKVCVAQAIGVRRTSKPTDITAALRKHPDAKVVICFLGSFEIEPLVKSLNDDLASTEFIFISSEGWGTRVDVSNFHNLVGSITLTCELPINQKFKDHLRNLNPSDPTTSPWLREYMENYFGCFYEWSMDKSGRQPCSNSNRLDFETDYPIDVWSSFAERAVLSLLQGAKLALDSLCGGSKTVCEAYRARPDVLFTKTKQIEFRDEGGTTRSRAFDDNGDGLAGYKIYVVDENNRYKRIGASGVTPFTFNDNLYPQSRIVNSTCGEQDYCRVCFRTTSGGGEEKDLPILWIVIVAVLVSTCLVLGIFVFCVCRRFGCCFTREGGQWRMNDTYLTPIHVHQRRKTGRTNAGGYEEDYDSIPESNRRTALDNDYITAKHFGISEPVPEENQQYI